MKKIRLRNILVGLENERKLQVYRDFFICITFLIISAILSLYFSKRGLLILKSDSSFHLSRAEEIYRNLKDGNLFTFIATHTFHHSGVGNFIFYPTIFLYPLAFLRFFVNPITAYYMWYGMFLFLTFIVAYYCMIKFSKGNRIRSYVFSLIYTISSYHLYLGIVNLVLGEFQAYTFLPIVFLSIYKILWEDRYRYWIALSIGMTALIYCHFVSVYLTSLFLAIIVFLKVNIKFLNKYQVYALIKAIGTSILLTIPVLFQFMYESFNNDIKSPSLGFKLLIDPSEMLIRSINNDSINQNLGIFLVVTMLIGWYFVKRDKKESTIYAIGVLFFICSTKLFPWEAIQHTKLVLVLGEMQFPYRLLLYSTLFLSITCSYIVDRILDLVDRKNILFVFICILLIGNYFGLISRYSETIESSNIELLTKATEDTVPLPMDSVVNKDAYTNIFSYSVLYGESDYYHNKSFERDNIYTISTNKMYLNEKEINYKVISLKPNRITYSVVSKSFGKLDLPFINYKNTKIYVNGNLERFEESNRGTIQLNVKKGKNLIDISYEPLKIYYYLIAVSVVTWIVILLCLIRVLLKQ